MPRPLDLIKRVAKLDSEDPNLAPFYEDAIRDTVERFEGHRLSGHNGRRPEEVSQFRDVLCAWASETPSRTVSQSRSQTVIRAACRSSQVNPARIGAGAGEDG